MAADLKSQMWQKLECCANTLSILSSYVWQVELYEEHFGFSLGLIEGKYL